jgi:Rieske Fe-S protein
MEGSRRLGSRFVRLERRTFLGTLVATLAAVRARVWAQAPASRRFRPLARAVEVPLADLSAPWRAWPFIAEAVTLPSSANPNQPLRISGMILRTSTAPDARAEQFCAVCVKCPHEHCDSDFVRDPRDLPAEVLQEIAQPVHDPVYLCPCHNSTFRADDGERLAGPAPRGLYLFRVTSVTGTTVSIGEVEEDVLIFG